MARLSRGLQDHPSYGSLSVNGQILPTIEGLGFFGPVAQGPTIRSAGYPSPATLPGSYSGGVTGYGSAGAWSWPLLIALLVLGAVGILIVHHLHWRA